MTGDDGTEFDSDNQPWDAIAVEDADLEFDKQEDSEETSCGPEIVPNHRNRRYNLRKKNEAKSRTHCVCAMLRSSFLEGESGEMGSHFIMYNFSLNCLCIFSNWTVIMYVL